MFKIINKDKKSRARLGEITTPHGIIRTPAFVPVASSATIKSLTPQEIKNCNIDVFFVNTYHMLFRPGIGVVVKMGGLHKFMNWSGPLMTDSGGFQAFSLGEYEPRNISQVANLFHLQGGSGSLARITNQGIYFKSIWDGKTIFLGPEESITAQNKLGADIIMSFDECTFYPIKKDYARSAMERTHRWALLSQLTDQSKPEERKQALYGIVQGSVFKDLRYESAKFISNLPFPGFAIGSVANSREPREKVFAVLDWTLPYLLPTQKPIHFLGVGEIEDMFISIGKGIDSFDCVTPTRLGRMGWIFDKKKGVKNKFRFDITKAKFSLDKNPPVKGCHCFTCQNFSRAYLNHLFRCRELLAYRLATIHNLYFFGKLMEDIREAIAENRFLKLKKEWLGIWLTFQESFRPPGKCCNATPSR